MMLLVATNVSLIQSKYRIFLHKYRSPLFTFTKQPHTNGKLVRTQAGGDKFV